jgi:uncharacterized membrane-anchored protein
MTRKPFVMATVAVLISFSPLTFAQTQPDTQPKPQIYWQEGPVTADLGGFAQLSIPASYAFTDKKGAEKVLEITHNLVSGREVGALVPTAKHQNWFVIFEFSNVGYVKDDEKDNIDANALLKSITEATEDANEERSKRGWPPYHVVGWEKSPYYDPATHNLTWSIRGKNDSGGVSVNHSIRLLGRKGTMDVDLILGPEEYARVLPSFDTVIGGFKFNPGSRYSDFVSGDKVAEYGLTALIAGGAGALAVKTGLLAKFWKVILAFLLAAKKLVIFIFAGIAALFRKIKNWITGRRSIEEDAGSGGTPLTHPENTLTTSDGGESSGT